MLELASIEQPKDPAEQYSVIRASAYPLCYKTEGWDGPRLASILDEHYDQVKLIGQDWVRLGLWSRYPTFGKLQTGQVIRIKEIVSFLYLRPRVASADTQVDTLDIFRVIDNIGIGDSWDDMQSGLRNIVAGRFDYNTESERQSGIPIYSALWEEHSTPAAEIGQNLNVTQIGNTPWSLVPEDLRRRLKAGLKSFSIQCDYKTPEGLALKGVAFYDTLIDLYIHCGSALIEPDPLSDEADLFLTSSVGGILDTLYTQGAQAFTKV